VAAMWSFVKLVRPLVILALNALSEIMENQCRSRQIYKEDTTNRTKWRKLNKDVV